MLNYALASNYFWLSCIIHYLQYTLHMLQILGEGISVWNKHAIDCPQGAFPPFLCVIHLQIETNIHILASCTFGGE